MPSKIDILNFVNIELWREYMKLMHKFNMQGKEQKGNTPIA